MRKHLCFLVSVKDAFLKGLICMGRQGLPHLDTDLAADLKKKGGEGGDVEMHPDLLSPKHQL